eukprot:Lankesteria_metandrocarpae@DN5108_c0_g1_i1.p1
MTWLISLFVLFVQFGAVSCYDLPHDTAHLDYIDPNSALSADEQKKAGRSLNRALAKVHVRVLRRYNQLNHHWFDGLEQEEVDQIIDDIINEFADADSAQIGQGAAGEGIGLTTYPNPNSLSQPHSYSPSSDFDASPRKRRRLNSDDSSSIKRRSLTIRMPNEVDTSADNFGVYVEPKTPLHARKFSRRALRKRRRPPSRHTC